MLFLLPAAATWFFWPRGVRAPGAYEQLALALQLARGEPCDAEGAERRVALARIIDEFQPRIRALWAARGQNDFPDFKMQQVGPVFLRLGSESKKKREDFEVSHWSWEEAQAAFTRTQSDPDSPLTKQRWRDLDTAVQFLLERDAARLLRGKKFLPPRETQHIFRPNAAVRRAGERIYEVRLEAGDFTGAEEPLAALLEKSWRSPGRQVKIVWVKDDPAAYRLVAVFRGGRSFVHHKRREMVIANFSAVSTVAHELGHVLGLDDHYYSVWHAANCYYSQESRLSDLMSSSEHGRVTKEHWDLLERAYPWLKAPLTGPFPYVFACSGGATPLCEGE